MITVRPAEPGDAPAIAGLAAAVHALHATALPEVFQPASAAPMTPGDVVGLIERAGPLFVVAHVAGTFAGYARAELLDEPATALKRAARVLHLHEMGVAPACRRHGVGRALLRAVRELAPAHGAQGVSLDVYAFNVEARAFYAREGFVSFRERLVARVEPADG
jgi:ribosomal protein S18 acetylase RimI-like enzyme